MQNAVSRSGAPAVWTTLSAEELRERLGEATEVELGIGREVRELPVLLDQAPEKPGAQETILLRGDSVPDYLAAAAAAWARTHSVTVRNGAKFSCSIASTLTVSGEACPSPEDDRRLALSGEVEGVVWFPGVNDVFFDVDGFPGTSSEGRRALIDGVHWRAAPPTYWVVR